MHNDHDRATDTEKALGLYGRLFRVASAVALMLLSSDTVIAATAVTFESHQLNVFPDGTPINVTIGDADNDGSNELVVVPAYLGLARIAKLNSAGGFVIVKDIELPTGARPIPPNSYVDPKVVDIDGDGDLDILVWLRGNNTKGLLIVAEFVAESHVVTTYPTPEVDAGYNFSVADVNGDGLPDIITTNLGFSSPGRVFVMLNAADSSRFTTSITLDAAGYAYRAFSADLNGDGRADLLSTTHPFGATGARLYFNNGDGSFSTEDLSTGDGTRTGDATFGDVNGDGELDIVLASFVPHNVTQTLKLFVRSGGTYSPPQTIVTGFGPQTPRFADFNEDGFPDLVVDDGAEGTLSIFYGDTNTGGLGPRTIISTPELTTTDHGTAGAPLPLTVGDIDNDGRVDIIFAVSRAVFLRNGFQSYFHDFSSLGPWRTSPTSEGECDGPRGPQGNVFCANNVIPGSESVKLVGVASGEQRIAAEIELATPLLPAEGTFAARVRFSDQKGGPKENPGVNSHASVKAFFTYSWNTRVVEDRCSHTEHDFEVMTGKSKVYRDQGWMTEEIWEQAHKIGPVLQTMTHNLDPDDKQSPCQEPGGPALCPPTDSATLTPLRIALGSTYDPSAADESYLTLVLNVRCTADCNSSRPELTSTYSIANDHVVVALKTSVTRHDVNSHPLKPMFNLWWLDPAVTCPPTVDRSLRYSQEEMDIDWFMWSADKNLFPTTAHTRGQECDAQQLSGTNRCN